MHHHLSRKGICFLCRMDPVSGDLMQWYRTKPWPAMSENPSFNHTDAEYGRHIATALWITPNIRGRAFSVLFDLFEIAWYMTHDKVLQVCFFCKRFCFGLNLAEFVLCNFLHKFVVAEEHEYFTHNCQQSNTATNCQQQWNNTEFTSFSCHPYENSNAVHFVQISR